MGHDLETVWVVLCGGGPLVWVSVTVGVVVVAAELKAERYGTPLIWIALSEGWLASYYLAAATARTVAGDGSGDSPLRLYYLSLEAQSPFAVAVIGVFLALGIRIARGIHAMRIS